MIHVRLFFDSCACYYYIFMHLASQVVIIYHYKGFILYRKLLVFLKHVFNLYIDNCCCPDYNIEYPCSFFSETIIKALRYTATNLSRAAVLSITLDLIEITPKGCTYVPQKKSVYI